MAVSVLNKYLSGVDYMENTMDKFGLMTGPNAQLKRAVIGGSIAGFLVTYIKPSWMFLPNGEARNWTLTNSNDPESTYFPWWTVSLGGAFILGVLI